MSSLFALLLLQSSVPNSLPQERSSVADEEIVVTGERVTRAVARTSSSVAVLTGKDIEGTAVDRLDQLLASIPNIQLGSGGEAPAMRGVDSTGALRDLPAFLGGTRPRLTLQVDGRAVNYNELAYGITPLWDVKQIEVYRSPQTGTQGRNAIAGSIFITTNDPSDRPTARVRMIVGEGGTRRFSMMASGPIEDQLRVRISADIRRGLATTKIASQADADPRRDDSIDLRLKLLAAPSALPGTKLQFVASHVTSASPQFNGSADPFRKRRDPFSTYGIFRTRVDALTMTLTSSVTSTVDLRATISGGHAYIRRHAPPGFGETRIKADDRSIDAALKWDATRNLQIVAGFRADRAVLDQHINLTATPIGEGDFRDLQQSYGVFAESEWKIAPPIALSIGARIQRDEQYRRGSLLGRLGTVGLDYVGRFDAILPKFVLTMQIAPGVNGGLMVQKAYNPGGTAIDLGRGTAQSFGAEKLWDYEAFIRVSKPDSRLRLSANIFHESMFNPQRAISRRIFTPAGAVGYAEIVNQPRAYSQGIEAGFEWQPGQGFELRGGLGLLRTKIFRAINPSDPSLDREFARAPHWSANLGATWRPVANVAVSGQMRHNDRYFSDDFETRQLRVGPATVVDARIDWTVGRATLFGYARNLFDTFYLTYKFVPVPTRPDLATPGDPRQVGVGLDIQF